MNPFENVFQPFENLGRGGLPGDPMEEVLSLQTYGPEGSSVAAGTSGCVTNGCGNTVDTSGCTTNGCGQLVASAET